MPNINWSEVLNTVITAVVSYLFGHHKGRRSRRSDD